MYFVSESHAEEKFLRSQGVGGGSTWGYTSTIFFPLSWKNVQKEPVKNSGLVFPKQLKKFLVQR